jgi:hypothetical protein
LPTGLRPTMKGLHVMMSLLYSTESIIFRHV